jgi:hypothetical protein
MASGLFMRLAMAKKRYATRDGKLVCIGEVGADGRLYPERAVVKEPKLGPDYQKPGPPSETFKEAFERTIQQAMDRMAQARYHDEVLELLERNRALGYRLTPDAILKEYIKDHPDAEPLARIALRRYSESMRPPTGLQPSSAIVDEVGSLPGFLPGDINYVPPRYMGLRYTIQGNPTRQDGFFTRMYEDLERAIVYSDKPTLQPVVEPLVPRWKPPYRPTPLLWDAPYPLPPDYKPPHFCEWNKQKLTCEECGARNPGPVDRFLLLDI